MPTRRTTITAQPHPQPAERPEDRPPADKSDSREEKPQSTVS